MNIKSIVIISTFSGLLFTNTILAQTIPDDPNHPLEMIGGRPSSNGNLTVSGRVYLEGLADPKERPVIYVIAYTGGRMVEKRQVSPSGAYSLSGMPRNNLTISFEIENVEVANYQIITPLGNIVMQNATISLTQIQQAKAKTGVIPANSLYQRSAEDQKLFEKAEEQIKLKKNDEAILILKQVVKNDEKDFIAWTQLGDLYFLKEKNDDAEKSYQEAIKQNPKFVPAVINLGRVQLIKNNSEKAIETLTQAVEMQPTSSDANYFLGEAYLFIKKGSKAVGFLNEAIKLDPIGKADAHLRLAALYNGANLKDRAAQEYKLYLEKVPNYKEKEKLEKYIKENLPN